MEIIRTLHRDRSHRHRAAARLLRMRDMTHHCAGWESWQWSGGKEMVCFDNLTFLYHEILDCPKYNRKDTIKAVDCYHNTHINWTWVKDTEKMKEEYVKLVIAKCGMRNQQFVNLLIVDKVCSNGVVYHTAVSPKNWEIHWISIYVLVMIWLSSVYFTFLNPPLNISGNPYYTLELLVFDDYNNQLDLIAYCVNGQFTLQPCPRRLCVRIKVSFTKKSKLKFFVEILVCPKWKLSVQTLCRSWLTEAMHSITLTR